MFTKNNGRLLQNSSILIVFAIVSRFDHSLGDKHIFELKIWEDFIVEAKIRLEIKMRCSSLDHDQGVKQINKFNFEIEKNTL